VLTKSIDEILKGISQVGLSIRGFYGEGTDVLGNIFQISNQTTLGKTEEEIIQTIDRVIQQLIGFEETACHTLMRDAHLQLEDKIWRAYGILTNARLLTSNDFMSLCSALRLGITIGVIKNISVGVINDLLLKIQPVHLQKLLHREMEASERDAQRATIVRDLLRLE
jgi:protein arginine kinase